ncbi:MAG: DNA recombination protein RmuC [Spirochaetae bacterium HGW-Spirochaetae-3]|jgi:DNA recombination protein RmuC|nr:MAG: DNA recombination protein RmuC [Spirochaetae bacterium HGW-Spirochaetae-3]
MSDLSFIIIALLLVLVSIILTNILTKRKYQKNDTDSFVRIKLLEEKSNSVDQLSVEVKELSGQKALAEERLTQIGSLQNALNLKSEDYIRAISENKEIRSQLEHQKTVLEQTYEKMQKDFQVLTQTIIDDSSKKLSERNTEDMKLLLNPLSERLGEFRVRLDATHDEQTKQRTTLETQIKTLSELNQRISLDAENLTKALKGDSKAQGTWGEMLLQKVLEASGLRVGEEYDIQVSLNTEDGKRLQPDAIVHLPGNRDVIIDSKVSLVSYEQFCSADTDMAKLESANSLVFSIRTHIKGLSVKTYHKLEGVNSIDYVLMFIPMEGAFSLAMSADRELIEYAMSQNIVLVSPTTLLATLRTIEYSWRSERQNQNVQQIFKLAGDLYDKFAAFAKDLSDIGSQINKSHETYEKAVNKLSAGKGNLTRRAEQLRELGAKNTKTLPSSWTGEEGEDIALIEESVVEPDES